jgi:hypothetical protein
MEVYEMKSKIKKSAKKRVKKVKKSPLPFYILETETIDFKFDFYKYISNSKGDIISLLFGSIIKLRSCFKY